jgi:Ca2+/Na+ antiporter
VSGWILVGALRDVAVATFGAGFGSLTGSVFLVLGVGFGVDFLVARVRVARRRGAVELASALVLADLAEARFRGARFGSLLASEVPSLMRTLL